MAIGTTTLTVNAAFFREVKEDNIELDRLLARVSAMLADPERPVCAARQVELLSRLRDQLALHFDLEEAFGYFEDPLEVAPQLHDKAESLRADHGRLLVMVSNLVEEAESELDGERNSPTSVAQGESLARFLDELREHERAENALILQAFDDDVGVGD